MQNTKRETGYTPGPWRAGTSLRCHRGTLRGPWVEIAQPGKVSHAYVPVVGLEGIGEEEAIANAALMAESPALVDALRAATAYVELFTGNGVQEQPPEWAIDEQTGEYSAEMIARQCRAVLAKINGEG